MRTLADLQRAPDAEASPEPATLPIAVEAVRRFDTPAFAGMTFYEVEAKSALNRVKGMPFEWSINPYRGCGHACTYCLAGDTPILMADGRTKPLSDVRVGDRVYGTRRRGHDRRLVISEVTDHWSTLKAAYRVELADGTRLVASGDHRFLTDRGWKHTTGATRGARRRPHLGTGNSLLGVGAFAEPPKKTGEYQRGYLCAMIRGDTHQGSHHDQPGRARGDTDRFRLALRDTQALDRTQQYLLAAGVTTQRYAFSAATDQRRALTAIGTSSREAVERIGGLVAWPTTLSEDWARGFAAGVFDAAGSCSRRVLRIHHCDPELLGWLGTCLERLAVPARFEPPRPNGCRSILVVGGLGARLRFLHLTDPAIDRTRSIEGVAVESDARLRVERVQPLGLELPMYDITTGTGDFIADGVVSHNCFARPTHAYLNLSPLGDFERAVVVKTNVAAVLRRELARPSWRGEHVAMGTNTDPYQRCEGRYRLMPDIVDALASAATPFSILTKGTLITRDVAALQAAAEQVEVSAALTVGMLDDTLWRAAEPGTPSPGARLDAVRQLNDAGIPTGVMLAPIMPGLNDDHEQLAALVEAAAAAGATHITPIVLHLRPGVREVFWPWLEATHPELVERYIALYANRRGGTAAADYRKALEAFVAAERTAAWRRHPRRRRALRARGPGRGRAGAAPAGTSGQLRRP